MVRDAEAKTTSDAVDALSDRFLRVPLDDPARAAIVELLNEELGTETLAEADSYLEYPLRLAAHGIMSAPQYQLA
jgi:hypothetical protein